MHIDFLDYCDFSLEYDSKLRFERRLWDFVALRDWCHTLPQALPNALSHAVLCGRRSYLQKGELREFG